MTCNKLGTDNTQPATIKIGPYQPYEIISKYGAPEIDQSAVRTVIILPGDSSVLHTKDENVLGLGRFLAQQMKAALETGEYPKYPMALQSIPRELPKEIADEQTGAYITDDTLEAIIMASTGAWYVMHVEWEPNGLIWTLCSPRSQAWNPARE